MPPVLFDTPGLNIKATPVGEAPAKTNGSKKRPPQREIDIDGFLGGGKKSNKRRERRGDDRPKRPRGSDVKRAEQRERIQASYDAPVTDYRSAQTFRASQLNSQDSEGGEAAADDASEDNVPHRALHKGPTEKEVSTAPSLFAGANVPKQLKNKLSGSKFRIINERLYTTLGAEARDYMQEEGMFEDYHAGFRAQAAQWPTNPVDEICADLQKRLDPKSLVADFGCGDAELARKLMAGNTLKVVSFDLVSQNGWVIEAECSSVPLPGGSTGGQIVDVVVCCLSLMGVDWLAMVMEAFRILRSGGMLKIAEVTSRFKNVDAFVKLVESIGFHLASKNDKNTHFIIFEFTKSSDAIPPRLAKKELIKKGELLKPCVYKKR